MVINYTTSLEEAVQLNRAWLYLTRPWLRPVRWKLIVVAVFFAGVYAALNPPESLINGEPSRLGSLLVALFFQVPLLTVMLFFAVRWLVTAPERGIDRKLRALPESHWGQRTLRVEADGFEIKGMDFSTSLNFKYVDAFRETADAFYFERDRVLVFALPKRVLTPEQAGELRQLRF